VITERQKLILNKIVEEYINSAWPVSSQLIEKKCGLGICPATIRIEMQKLTRKGYLYQPYTSAGRIPTDKGYRFFVNKLLENGVSQFDESEIEKWFKKEASDTVKFVQLLVKNLSSACSALALGYLQEKEVLLKEGWEKVLEEPEFSKKSQILKFARFLKDFEENISSLKINSGIKIYIGKENTFSKTKDFSIISSKCCLPEGGQGIISLLGPKRMTYEKSVGLLRSLTKFLEDVK